MPKDDTRTQHGRSRNSNTSVQASSRRRGIHQIDTEFMGPCTLQEFAMPFRQTDGSSMNDGNIEDWEKFWYPTDEEFRELERCRRPSSPRMLLTQRNRITEPEFTKNPITGSITLTDPKSAPTPGQESIGVRSSPPEGKALAVHERQMQHRERLQIRKEQVKVMHGMGPDPQCAPAVPLTQQATRIQRQSQETARSSSLRRSALVQAGLRAQIRPPAPMHTPLVSRLSTLPLHAPQPSYPQPYFGWQDRLHPQPQSEGLTFHHELATLAPPQPSPSQVAAPQVQSYPDPSSQPPVYHKPYPHLAQAGSVLAHSYVPVPLPQLQVVSTEGTDWRPYATWQGQEMKMPSPVGSSALAHCYKPAPMQHFQTSMSHVQAADWCSYAAWQTQEVATTSRGGTAEPKMPMHDGRSETTMYTHMQSVTRANIEIQRQNEAVTMAVAHPEWLPMSYSDSQRLVPVFTWTVANPHSRYSDPLGASEQEILKYQHESTVAPYRREVKQDLWGLQRLQVHGREELRGEEKMGVILGG
ncbi:hypothetical protein CVT26_013642 [Gymnopilus dilepis]|uniref:Uncharacterized protein n=1 Tax=Gymnopilus dilepis TaxID=231916 RepID=A0A409YWC4_9AGAR|nr:hypothetical protein CVT26_013642 [Gymnopilus dilepis]